MLIDITQISNGQTNCIDIDVDIAPAKWAVTFQSFELTDNASFRGQLSTDDKDAISLSGRLNVHIVGVCVRCLDPVPMDLDIPIHECYEQSGQNTMTENDCYSYQRSVIDLIPALRDNLVLSVPQRILCREDCKGICPECGVHLNQKTCGCSQKGLNQENPFSQLKELL